MKSAVYHGGSKNGGGGFGFGGGSGGGTTINLNGGSGAKSFKPFPNTIEIEPTISGFNLYNAANLEAPTTNISTYVPINQTTGALAVNFLNDFEFVGSAMRYTGDAQKNLKFQFLLLVSMMIIKLIVHGQFFKMV